MPKSVTELAEMVGTHGGLVMPCFEPVLMMRHWFSCQII